MTAKYRLWNRHIALYFPSLEICVVAGHEAVAEVDVVALSHLPSSVLYRISQASVILLCSDRVEQST